MAKAISAPASAMPPKATSDTASASASASASSASSASSAIPAALEELALLLETQEHALASIAGSAGLARRALEATKGVFDLGIALEAQSHPHLHPFLASIMNPPPIQLRSSRRADSEPEMPAPEDMLPYTPLGELTVADMEAEQVWEQLELRAEGICRVVKEVGSGDAPDEDEDEREHDEFGSGSDDEMTAEEWERMMEEEYDGASGSEDEDDEEEDGEIRWNSDEEDGEIRWNSDEEMEMGSDLGSDLGTEGSDVEGEDDEDDDDDEASGSDVEMDDASDAGSAGSDDRYAPGPSKPRTLHPVLDDQFFSIDEFNRVTEELEAGRVTSGALGGDEDEDAELDDIGQMFLEEGDDDAEIMYGDFFAAPERLPDAKSGKKDETKKKRTKKSKVMFDEEEEEEAASKPEEQERDVMERVKGDLFDDSDDDNEDTAEALSTHERRQRALAAQIAQLESEAIGPKDWTLMGEASARLRPENSLLEEDLDFEHVAKAVPTITEETVATLEELIKRRILDNHFDSPERVRAYEPTAFLPSRFFELNDTKSTQSLAQIYEDEYTATASGGKAPDARDAKLAAEHGEIDRLWGDISYKLDALCSLHFVPRAPAAAITTLENIATTSLETALPATKAATSMLAPHEVFVPTARELTARSEQTPEEAKTARARARRGNKANRAKLETTQKLYGKKRTSVREDKEAALQHLVKSGKGVTVLGKGAKEDGKRRKREEVSVADAKRLKL